MTESGAQLTTSRASRLLRPLKNKCNSLAALNGTATASRVASLKQPASWDPNSRPPLAMLCWSTGTKKLTVDRHSADDFELSRRIRAVGDAFKNLVHVAFGKPHSQHIPSLAAMCTLVIGENMPSKTSDSSGSGEDPTNDSDVLDIDDIYEAVPPHYRRYLIVSHALSMVLCSCTHHHTLMTILLDHCLSFGLVHQSTHLLDIVLAQAFLPPNLSHPPPVTHPAHTSYLLDLHGKWTSGNHSPLGSLLFTTSAFCESVLDALSQSAPSSLSTLWTSKVLNGLLHAIETSDIDSYIVIIRALSQGLRGLLCSSPDDIRDDSPLVILRGKLSELMSNLFDMLFTQHFPLLTTSTIHAVIDVLSDCYSVRLHCLRTTPPGSPIDLSDMVTVFTSQIFVALRHSVGNSEHLLAILDDSSPIPTTFSKLMVHLSRPREIQSFEDFAEGFLAELKKYSSAFRSEKLFGLEASLWACALHHFEISITGSQKGNSIIVAKYKQQLMEAVDSAEHRCFGRNMGSSPVIRCPARSSLAKRAQRGRLNGHWEWEDMVGTWIRKTPVHKKRKIDHGRLYDSSQHGRSRPQTAYSKMIPRPILSSSPLSTCRRRFPSFSPSSAYSQPSETEFLTEGGSEYQEESDKENSSPAVEQPHPIRRQSSNFFSLLADAQTNRIVLHPKPRLKPKPPSSIIPEKCILPFSSQESKHVPHKQEQKTGRRMVVLPPVSSRTSLLSDDSLNLFACATSSPSRY